MPAWPVFERWHQAIWVVPMWTGTVEELLTSASVTTVAPGTQVLWDRTRAMALALQLIGLQILGPLHLKAHEQEDLQLTQGKGLFLLGSS